MKKKEIIIEIQGSHYLKFERGHYCGSADNGFGVCQSKSFNRKEFNAGGVMSRGEAWRLIRYMLPHLLFSWRHIWNSVWTGDELGLYFNQQGLKGFLEKHKVIKRRKNDR